MKRAQNSDSKTHVKKQNPTSRTEIRWKSLKYLFLETPCIYLPGNTPLPSLAPSQGPSQEFSHAGNHTWEFISRMDYIWDEKGYIFVLQPCMSPQTEEAFHSPGPLWNFENRETWCMRNHFSSSPFKKMFLKRYSRFDLYNVIINWYFRSNKK